VQTSFRAHPSLVPRRGLLAHLALLGALALVIGIAAAPRAEARQVAPPLVLAGPGALTDDVHGAGAAPSAPRGPLASVPPTAMGLSVARWDGREPGWLAEGAATAPPGVSAPSAPGLAVAATTGASSRTMAQESASSVADPGLWSGRVQPEGANLRAAPRRAAPLLDQLAGGAAVQVARWVQGDEVVEENPVWAELADGGYVFSATLQRAPLADAAPQAARPLVPGRWIDVDVTRQALVAYEGSRPVRTLLVSTGRPGWDTPLGEFAIRRRVDPETMDAATLAGEIPTGQATPSYRIENVRYVQYFSADGAAFHANTWRSPDLFGMPGSHGCVSLLPDDAAWLWGWAAAGTPVRIHA